MFTVKFKSFDNFRTPLIYKFVPKLCQWTFLLSLASLRHQIGITRSFKFCHQSRLSLSADEDNLQSHGWKNY